MNVELVLFLLTGTALAGVIALAIWMGLFVRRVYRDIARFDHDITILAHHLHPIAAAWHKRQAQKRNPSGGRWAKKEPTNERPDTQAAS